MAKVAYRTSSNSACDTSHHSVVLLRSTCLFCVSESSCCPIDEFNNDICAWLWTVGTYKYTGRVFFAGAGHYILILFRYGSELMLSLPGSVFVAGRPELWQVMVYYILLFLFSQRKRVVVWIEKRAARRCGEAECEAKKHREVGREAVKGGARKGEAEKLETGKCVMGANIF